MAGTLGELIHAATNSSAMAVEDPLLKAIKSLVRASDENVKESVELLMDRLAKNHSQVRYLALLIIDELFTRSKLFRNHLVNVFEKFLLLSVGYRTDHSLPPPKDRAALLKSKALEFVEKWNEMFGPHYKQLRLGYEYLKNTLRMKFPELQQAATRAQEERDARERRTQDLLRCRLLQLTDNFAGLKKDIVSTIDQMEECFAILNDSKGDEEAEAFSGEDEEETEVYGIQKLRLARGDEEETVPEESRDNESVFDMIRDLVKLISTRHLPATQEWLSVLMRVDPENRQSRDSLMKEVIDLRNRLVALESRCQELGIDLFRKSKAEVEDDIEWEEEHIDERSQCSPKDRPEQQEKKTTCSLNPVKTAEALATTTTSDLKRKLLEEAPVLSWGSFLDGWGTEAAVPANAKGLFLDNHWGRVDPDVLIPTERLAEMRVRASYYQPEKSDIRPCLAPMRNGGLCQRKDLRKCPLHGIIVSRDEQGSPLKQKCGDEAASSSKELPTPEELAAQAVKNVRNRDEAERKELRRSQAKVDRQHNEAVLRSAAIGHESLLTAESSENIQGEVTKKRKGGRGLTAMLHKKPTSKDRIAKKLLTGRAADSAVATLSRAEDAKYRESFPNQW